MRLIDADKAIQDYAKYGKMHPYDATDLEDILDECPIVQAIPLIELQKMRYKIASITTVDTDGQDNHWYREPQEIMEDVLSIIDELISNEVTP